MSTLDVAALQNAVLVDIAALSEVFDGYEDHLTPFQLQDIFNLLEQIIFRDRIVAIGGSRMMSPPAYKAMDIWVKEGALFIPKRRITPLKFNLNNARIPDPPFATVGERARVARSIGRLASAEQDWHLPGMPLGGQRHFYDQITAADLENQALFDLAAQFNKLTQKHRKSLLSDRPERRYLVDLQLPPLAFLVFKKVDRLCQVPTEALAVRRRFSKLREDLRSLVELLRDREKSDAAKFREVRLWTRAWEHAADADLGSINYGFRIGTNALPQAMWAAWSMTVVPSSDDTSAMLGVLPTLAEVMHTAYRELGPKFLLMRPVYQSLEEYLSTNARQRYAVLNRVAGSQLRASWERAREVRSRFGHFVDVPGTISSMNISSSQPRASTRR